MSCDLNEPALKQAYEEVRSNGPAKWFVAGYKDTKDVITLYKKAATDFQDLKQYVSGLGEVLYVYVKVEQKMALITFISEKITGVKRARALVHGRMVNQTFKDNSTFWTITSSAEFTEEALRRQLRLDSENLSKKPSNVDVRAMVKEQSTPAQVAIQPSQQSARIPVVTQSILDLNAREEALSNEDSLKYSRGMLDETLIARNHEDEEDSEEEYSPSDIYGDYNKTSVVKADKQPDKPKATAKDIANEAQKKVQQRNVEQRPVDQVPVKVAEVKPVVAPVQLDKPETTKPTKSETNLLKSEAREAKQVKPEVKQVKQEEVKPELSKHAQETTYQKHGQFYAMTPSSTWVLRAFMVTKQALLLFNENKQPPKLVREISLDKLTAITPTSDEILIKNSFKLVYEGNRTQDDQYFYCDSAEEMAQLVNRILARM